MQTPETGHRVGAHPLPADPSEFLVLARSAQQRGDLLEAVRLLEEANKRTPDHLPTLIDLANVLRLLSRLEESESVFTEALTRSPGHVAALVGLGHIARQRGRHSDALAHFEAAAKNAPNNINIRGEIGNSLISTNQPQDAEAIFLSILEKEPRDLRALLGLATLARERRQWQIALKCFEKAAEVRPDEISIHVEMANLLRALGRLDEAAARCGRILDKSPADPGALIAMASVERARRNYETSLRYLEKAADIDPSKLTVQVEIGNILREMGRLDEGEVIFNKVLEKQPDQTAARLGLGFIARHRSNFDAALVHFQAALATDPGSIRVQLELARTLWEAQRLEEGEASYFRILDQSPNNTDALLGLGYIARERSDWSAALAHFEAAKEADPGNLKAQLEVASTLRELLRVDEAEAIFQRLAENPDVSMDPDFQAKSLEHFCKTLQLEKAGEYLAAWGGHLKVPSGAVAFAAAYYAARGTWNDVLDLFQERVVECAVRPKVSALLLEAISRAARATGEYARVLSLLRRLPAGSSSPDVSNLRDQIGEELRLLNTLDLHNGDHLLMDYATLGSPLRAWRSDLVERILRPDSLAKPDKTIYFCTDRNYLPGAVVAVSSLLRNNMGELRNYCLRIYCSDDIVDLSASIFAELGMAYCFPIDLRVSTSLIPTGSNFRTGWGMFTPGHGLSEAAYYRIYAALQLLQEGTKGRALYIDCDVCVGVNLNELLGFDLQNQPLGARRENATLTEIRRAALRLDIPPEQYFNSGVLLFELAHPELESALRRAVEASLTQKQILTFVDQCALNLAFRDLYSALPDHFNLFVRESTPVDAANSNPVVRHFLQRPKPWDPMYSSANSKPWFEEFAALAQVVSADKLKQLFALQFPNIRSSNQARSG